jgi:protoporphyrinogen IX oxidase
MYLYVKALHIIFVVTWFAGLFYVVRLFIYNREAQDKTEPERKILQEQFTIMIRRLWFGITWPSCVLTLIFGGWMMHLFGSFPGWLLIKLGFVAGLLLYHVSLHILYKQQSQGIFKYTSQQLRLWNEVATVFLVAIVMLVVVKSSLGLWRGLGGLLAFSLVLMAAIKIYKISRRRQA